MAIARVAGQTAQAAGSNSAASVQITFPQNVVAGNFISACGAHRTSWGSMADNLSNTYGLDVDFNGGGAHDGAEEIVLTSAKKLTTGGSCTITWTPSGTSRIGLCAMEYSGFGGDGAALDDSATKDELTPTTSLETNAADLSTSEGLGIAFLMQDAFGVPVSSWGNSFVSVAVSDGNNGRCEMADRVLSASGSYEATATLAGTDAYVAALALYKPASVWIPEQNSTRTLHQGHGHRW